MFDMTSSNNPAGEGFQYDEVFGSSNQTETGIDNEDRVLKNIQKSDVKRFEKEVVRTVVQGTKDPLEIKKHQELVLPFLLIVQLPPQELQRMKIYSQKHIYNPKRLAYLVPSH